MGLFLLLVLGICIGMIAVGWPLMQVYFSFVVGLPIAKRFEHMDGVIPGAHPVRRYAIGGFVNLAVMTIVVWSLFEFGSRPVMIGAGLSVAFVIVLMFGQTRQAGIEAYDSMRPELNWKGNLMTDDDLARHGIATRVEQSDTYVIPDPDQGSILEGS